MKARVLKRLPLPPRDEKGFTLVEVIVVLVIIAILMAIAVPALTGYIDRAREQQYLSEARSALTAYQTIITESVAEHDYPVYNAAYDYQTAKTVQFYQGKNTEALRGAVISYFRVNLARRYLEDVTVSVAKEMASLTGDSLYNPTSEKRGSFKCIAFMGSEIGTPAFNDRDGYVWIYYDDSSSTIHFVGFKVGAYPASGYVTPHPDNGLIYGKLVLS
jgi:prepilin-type N-terminal cleavage/methylation domain-containing protein